MKKSHTYRSKRTRPLVTKVTFDRSKSTLPEGQFSQRDNLSSASLVYTLVVPETSELTTFLPADEGLGCIFSDGPYIEPYLTPSRFFSSKVGRSSYIATGMSIRSEFFAKTTWNASRDRGAFYEAIRYGFRCVYCAFFSRRYDGSCVVYTDIRTDGAPLYDSAGK